MAAKIGAMGALEGIGPLDGHFAVRRKGVRETGPRISMHAARRWPRRGAGSTFPAVLHSPPRAESDS